MKQANARIQLSQPFVAASGSDGFKNQPVLTVAIGIKWCV
jgi:hypothetical protein